MKIKIALLSLPLLFTLFAKPVSAVTFEHAMSHYLAGNFEEAFEGFSELAPLGNGKAQFNIGVMYARGEFVKQSTIDAYAWLKIAALSEAQAEQSKKTLAIVAKKLDENSKKQAEEKYALLLKDYSPQVILKKLFPLLQTDENSGFIPMELKKHKAAKYPKSELRKGNSGWADFHYSVAADGSVRNIECIVSESEPFKKAALKALKSFQYQPATMNGVAVAQHGIKMRFSFSIAGSQLHEQKVAALVAASREKAVQGGSLDKYKHAYTLSLIESLPEESKGNKMHFEPSRMWFSKAAQDGSPFAKFEIGRRMGYGHQCAVQGNKAFYWIESAAKDQLADAEYLLGTQTYQGIHCDKDETKGLALIKTAADKDFVPAILEYAWLISSHRDENIRQPEIALQYLQKINLDQILDHLSYYETQAIAYAALGDFTQANSALEKAKKERKRYKLPGGITQDIATKIEANRIYTL